MNKDGEWSNESNIDIDFLAGLASGRDTEKVYSDKGNRLFNLFLAQNVCRNSRVLLNSAAEYFDS